MTPSRIHRVRAPEEQEHRPRFNARGRILHASSGRRLLLAYVEARDPEGRRVTTLSDLAKRCDVDVSTLSLIANGFTREPSLALARRLRDLIGISVDAWEPD